MPARSKSQQRLFGMLHAYNKGELECSKSLKAKLSNLSKHISDEDAEHFAKTKHEGLPEKKAAAVTTTATATLEEQAYLDGFRKVAQSITGYTDPAFLQAGTQFGAEHPTATKGAALASGGILAGVTAPIWAPVAAGTAPVVGAAGTAISRFGKPVINAAKTYGPVAWNATKGYAGQAVNAVKSYWPSTMNTLQSLPKYAWKAYNWGGPKMFEVAKAFRHPIAQGQKYLNAFRTAPVATTFSSVTTPVGIGISANMGVQAYDYANNAKKSYDAFVQHQPEILALAEEGLKKVDEQYPGTFDLVKDNLPKYKQYVQQYAKDNWFSLARKYGPKFLGQAYAAQKDINKLQLDSRRSGVPISEEQTAEWPIWKRELANLQLQKYRNINTIPTLSKFDALNVTDPVADTTLKFLGLARPVIDAPLALKNTWDNVMTRGKDAISTAANQGVEFMKLDKLQNGLKRTKERFSGNKNQANQESIWQLVSNGVTQ